MEKSQGNSFIPKNPVRGTVKPRGVKKIYILTYVSYVLFFGTLLATVGTFVYGVSVDSQLVTEKNRLAAERELFNQADLERVRELEARMNTAFTILDRHVSLHSIMLALETATVRPVQIEGFEYVKDVDNSLNLTLIARTENFNNALFQREIFVGNNVLNGSKISEVAYQEAESGDGLDANEEEVKFTITKKLSVSEIPFTVTSFSTADSFTQPLDELEYDSTVEAPETGLEVPDIINE